MIRKTVYQNQFYWDRYIKFVESCKLHKRYQTVKYYEKHHIVPRCIGGSNKSDNIVYLTFREHFIAHMLLTKALPNHKGLKSAMTWFTRTRQGVPILNSRQFDICKNISSEANSGENHPMYGKKRSKEVRARVSLSKSGKNHPMYGKKLSDAQKAKIGKAVTGSKNGHYDTTIYKFINEKLDVSIECTQYELRHKYALNAGHLSAVCNGKEKTHKGWRLQ